MNFQDGEAIIIGAGIGQINIIKKAQKMGFHVTVVSQPGNYPGLDLADDIIYCDIYDREKIVDLAKDIILMQSHQIRMI